MSCLWKLGEIMIVSTPDMAENSGKTGHSGSVCEVFAIVHSNIIHNSRGQGRS